MEEFIYETIRYELMPSIALEVVANQRKEQDKIRQATSRKPLDTSEARKAINNVDTRPFDHNRE